MINIELQTRLGDSKSNDFELAVDLSLPAQGVTAIYGHSGSGKTTLLRSVAGLHRAKQASIRLNDQVWQDQQRFVPVHQRSIGYVFQESGLFPHLSAEDNLKFAIKRSRQPIEPAFYQKVVETFGINHCLNRKPSQLSGGEKQRVAIARALLVRPQLLLMDEPLASLDLARRAEILPYLDRLQQDFSIPVLYVTHSLDEIVRLADYAVVLNQGRVEQQGLVAEVFSIHHQWLSSQVDTKPEHNPVCIVETQVVSRDSQWHLMQLAFNGGQVWMADNLSAIGQKQRLKIDCRDISLSLNPEADSSILNRIPARVTDIRAGAHPSLLLVYLLAGDTSLVAQITRRSAEHLKLSNGMQCWAQIKSAAIVR